MLALAPLLVTLAAASPLEQDLQRISAAAGWPGAAAVVVQPGKPPELAFAGPVREDTRLYLGSVTKSLTALTVLRLAAAGRVALDAPATTYVPSLRFSGPAPTVRQLLQHRSGLSTRAGYRRLPDAPPGAPPDLGELDLGAAPGARFEYSNLNYALLGLVIEAVAGTSYGEALRAEVLAPLGMSDAAALPPEGPGLAAGSQAWFGLLHAPARHDAPSRLSAPAGFVAVSPRDAAKLLAMLATGGALPDGGRFLPEPLWREMLAPPEGARGYALGFMVFPWRGATSFAHDGLLKTAAASLQVWPADGLAAAVLVPANEGVFAPARDALLGAVRARFDGREPPGYTPVERAIRLALGLALLWAFLSLVRAFRRWRRAGSPRPWAPTAAPRATAIRVGLHLAAVAGVLAWFRPPPQLLAFQPDLGLALVGGALASIIAAALGGAARGVERARGAPTERAA